MAMNGNGFSGQEPEIEPPSSGGLWAEMFGIGPLLKMITDPALGQHAHQMMQAIIEGTKASARIEAKLDLILKGQGYEPDAIGFTALPTANGAVGARGLTPASVSADNGNRQSAGQSVGIDEPVATGGGGAGTAKSGGT